MILLLVMCIGACAGSTTGGIKVFRIVLGAKIVRAQIEQTWHPTVVRNVWLQKNVVNRDQLIRVAIFFLLYFAVAVIGTLVILVVEPDATWLAKGFAADRKLLDVPIMVLTCLSNCGPGVGIIGANGNYGVLAPLTKLLLTGVMLLGRLEIFAVLAVLSPRFWRSHA
jgi:trk system potassium uptake protein TrkH